MIRGAGDILGPEQAGFIDSIGLDMYIKLLNEAVQEKLNGAIVEDKTIENNASLNIDAYIPSEYADDSNKIELYQEIISCDTLESLNNIKNKTTDIYGKLPEEVNALFAKRKIDLLIKEAAVKSLTEGSKFVDIVLGDNYINIRGAGNVLFEALIPYLSDIKVSYINRTFKIQVIKNKKWVDNVQNILETLLNILEVNKIKREI